MKFTPHFRKINLEPKASANRRGGDGWPAYKNIKTSSKEKWPSLIPVHYREHGSRKIPVKIAFKFFNTENQTNTEFKMVIFGRRS